VDCGQVNILLEVNHRPLAHYIEEDVMADQQSEHDYHRKKADELDAKVAEYLEQLTKVATLDDLLQGVRDAAGWALVAHKTDVERRHRHG